MKKLIVVVVLLAMGMAVFALGTRQAMTQDEALALIDQKAIELNLSIGDKNATEDAFMALIEAKVQVRNAFQIVSGALDEGLKNMEMTQLATQIRDRIKQGQSAGQCEDAAKDMIRERIRLREGELNGETKQTETQGVPESTGKK